MTSCAQNPPAPFRCPTLEESIDATIALAPRGRAWPVNDGGGLVRRFRAWLAGLAAVPAPEEWPAGYVQAGWFSALGAERNAIEARLCELRNEFWCATHVETHAEWMAEYGLPDACDPFPDLCAKVAALGGTRCDYYLAIAQRAGWEIECEDVLDTCGAVADCFFADNEEGVAAGASPACELTIRVHLAESPAYQGAFEGMPYADAFQADMMLACDPDIEPLKCLLERVVHAHVEIVYEIVPPPVFIMADAATHLATESGAYFVTAEQ